jgi:hypothetical protein
VRDQADRRPVAEVAKVGDDALERLTEAFRQADKTAYEILRYLNTEGNPQ